MDNLEKRAKIIEAAKSQLDKPYIFGAEVDLKDPSPKAFDCSEFVQWCYAQAGIEIADGSFNQYDFTMSIDDPLPGDLGFFKERDEQNLHGRKVGEIYHVGIVVGDGIRIIEARGAPYNKVLYRPMAVWREFRNFGGWRRHPALTV